MTATLIDPDGLSTIAALARFLAATQYYKGGHYQKALALGGKLQARLLPSEVRQLLPGFLRDAQ